MVSYSPDTTLIAEHFTEAFIIASFSGQPNCPCQYKIKGDIVFIPN